MGIANQLIPSGILQYYNTGVDATLEFGSIPTTLVYPGSKHVCPNCIQYQIAGTISSARLYKTGGPIPFSQGQSCPYCQGLGYTIVEKTDIYNAVVYFDTRPAFQRNIITTDIQLNQPSTYIQTKSFFTDYPRVIKAEKLRLSQFTAANRVLEFQMFGEPLPVGFNNRYLLTNWKRI